MSERRQVKVACSIPNGLTIHLFQPGHDDGTGHRPMTGSTEMTLAGPSALQTGVNSSGADLQAPFTLVDEEAMRAWLSQNAKNPIVTSGSVYIIEEQEAEQPQEVLPPERDQRPESETQFAPGHEAGGASAEGGGGKVTDVAGDGEGQGDGGEGTGSDTGTIDGEGDQDKPKAKPFDAALVESGVGYQKGEVVASLALPGVDWISTVDGNVTDPDSGEASGWEERQPDHQEANDE